MLFLARNPKTTSCFAKCVHVTVGSYEECQAPVWLSRKLIIWRKSLILFQSFFVLMADSQHYHSSLHCSRNASAFCSPGEWTPPGNESYSFLRGNFDHIIPPTPSPPSLSYKSSSRQATEHDRVPQDRQHLLLPILDDEMDYDDNTAFSSTQSSLNQQLPGEANPSQSPSLVCGSSPTQQNMTWMPPRILFRPIQAQYAGCLDCSNYVHHSASFPDNDESLTDSPSSLHNVPLLDDVQFTFSRDDECEIATVPRDQNNNAMMAISPMTTSHMSSFASPHRVSPLPEHGSNNNWQKDDENVIDHDKYNDDSLDLMSTYLLTPSLQLLSCCGTGGAW